MVGLCHYRLGMLREAEKQLLSANKTQPMVLTYHLLAKVYVRLDQPLNAVACYESALERFGNDTSLLAAAVGARY